MNLETNRKEDFKQPSGSPRGGTTGMVQVLYTSLGDLRRLKATLPFCIRPLPPIAEHHHPFCVLPAPNAITVGTAAGAGVSANATVSKLDGPAAQHWMGEVRGVLVQTFLLVNTTNGQNLPLRTCHRLPTICKTHASAAHRLQKSMLNCFHPF